MALLQRVRMSVMAFRTWVVWSVLHPESGAKMRPYLMVEREERGDAVARNDSVDTSIKKNTA